MALSVVDQLQLINASAANRSAVALERQAAAAERAAEASERAANFVVQLAAFVAQMEARQQDILLTMAERQAERDAAAERRTAELLAAVRPSVTIAPGAVQVSMPTPAMPEQRPVVKRVQRDAQGLIATVTEEPI
jgi:hypothetical protein